MPPYNTHKVHDTNAPSASPAMNMNGKPVKKASLVQQLNFNSTLVKRARLIRRRTTTKYSERLRQLHERDEIVIYQILVIRLKDRESATEFERACVNAPNARLIPSVDFAYPPMGARFDEFPPLLFYPDFMKGSVQRKEELDAFRVVLTNEKGDRTFAYCFKFLWNEPIHDNNQPSTSTQDTGDYSVLVFASHYPHEALFHRLASDFVMNVQKNGVDIDTMCKDLLNLRHTTSEDSYLNAKYAVRDFPIGSGDNSYDGGGGPSRWPRAAVSTATIQRFGAECTMFIFLSLLAEKRVIVTGSNVTEVSRVVHSFVRLLAPMEWPHTLIPIVPDSKTELCFNPTPYVCGVLRYNLNRVKDLLCPIPGEMEEDITIVDVERGVILPFLLAPTAVGDRGLKTLLKFTSTMIFPRAVVLELLNGFRTLLPVKNPAKADYKLEKYVMIFYAKLFGHFKRFGIDIFSTRGRKRFVQAHPCADTRHFLKWFVENGILQTFVVNYKEDENESADGSDALTRRFANIVKKYGPPVDKAGKRRKAKSIVWRIFTR